MLAVERQRVIAHAVTSAGVAKVTNLAQELGVSEMTIRRDIEVLSDAGQVRKVHGGAVSPGNRLTFEPGFKANVETHLGEKQAIARAALEFVEPGMAIGVTGGSTTYQMAEGLASRGPLTVVTNSFPFAARLHASTANPTSTTSVRATGDPSARISVILTGGEMTPSEALVGPITDRALGELSMDVCFMGVRGVHAETGLSTPNLLEAATNRAFASSAGRLIVLADASKFGVRALNKIVDLATVDNFIIDTLTDATNTSLANVSPDCVFYTSDRTNPTAKRESA